MIDRQIGPGARLHHLQLTAEDPSRVADFHARAMMMRSAPFGEGYLCEGPARRILFVKGPKQRTGFSAFAFENEIALNAYRDQIEARGIIAGRSPSPLFDETAFSVADPDGNLVVFGTAPPEDAPANPGPDARLQHVTMRTRNLPELIEHYTDKLGFFLADIVSAEKDEDLRTAFFASDAEHHSFAAFKADEARLDHHSYELSGWDMIRDWADHFASLGLSLRWGPGRHGPGNNLFIFLEDPEGNWIELSAELEVMDVERKTGRWPHSARSLNLWGEAIMRS